jgi:diaminopimelate decarboxylase
MGDVNLPKHEFKMPFKILNHELVVGNLPISQLAARVGSTPFYAYDQQLISERVSQLRRHLPKDFAIHYAMKANPFPAVVAQLKALTDGFDVSSIKEIAVALEAGMMPGNISFSGPGKTEKEIVFAVKSGIVIHLESERQLELTIAAGKTLGVTPKVAVRVNPDFEVKGSKMKMGGGAKQFGVDTNLVPGMLKKIAESDLHFEGFHIFSSSQNLNSEAIIETLKNSFELTLRLAQTTSAPIKSLVIGGGFGIPYFPGDKPIDLPAIGKTMNEFFQEIKTRLPATKIAIELGRYLVGEAGVYICKVIDKKISCGHTFLIVDGGMNHHLAASGHLGQVIRKNYPVAIANKMDVAPTETVSIVGPLCTPLDLLADKVELPQAQIGDLVVIFQSGAYGLTASPINFLSHDHPAEISI